MADVVIVGGGPAGMMAGLLFARAGISTLVLEKHGDFLRDFRGDTVHPSTLRIFDELGELDTLLARPHDKAQVLGGIVGGEKVTIADFSHLPGKCRFIALMPQWEFLDCVTAIARRHPAFELRMNAEATGLIEEDGQIVGVACIEDGVERTYRSRLVIAADGRRSVLRGQSGLPLTDLGAPIDVFWFKLSKTRTPDNRSTGVIATGRLLAVLDRGDYWQCAYVFAKGSAERLRAAGIGDFREDVARTAPFLAGSADELTDWDQVKLLTVSLDRLDRWHRPGLIVIGDAAHAMSPIGGVGINLAIQDAVAAANILAGPLAAGGSADRLLDKVQRRRMLPTRLVQSMQRAAQTRLIAGVILRNVQITRAPWQVRLMQRFPVLQRIPAYVIGIGFRSEHVRSPKA
ncbi:FAD-dependent oxidoreductase [Sphingomonas sp. SUN039]|uniref:FAD-dependent oxidoreductase n=1 Tax=Sphingomonas sp. SUN039 TaxID=2937787 RepID=UPI002164E628|nr:FAD-dependent oxidoreductase [Sphingomonas sp. SUN039]UVO53269.1 FAD-dependent oxidoreductase [Sphingomonas sp. SUN039]